MGIGTIFLLSFVTALSGALTPGPLLTVTIAQTARRGFIASVLLVAGHSLLELLVVIGLVFGLGHVLKIKPVLGTITILGGTALLWMGCGMIREARRGSLDLHATAANSGSPAKAGILENPVIAGAAVSISNPYWVIWWATIGLTLFAAFSKQALASTGSFYLGHIMGDIVWYVAVGAAISTGRRLFTPAVYRAIVQVCGAFLVLLGASFLYLLASGGLWRIDMTLGWLKG